MSVVTHTGSDPHDMTTLSEKQEANRLCGYVIGSEGEAVKGWKFDTLSAGRLALPCSLMLLMLIGIALVALLMPLLPGAVPYLAALQLLLAGLSLYQLRRMLRRMRSNVIEPLEQLRQWARVMRSGRLSARVPIPDSGEFVELTGDINRLGERLEELTNEMDERVHKQTTRLAHQTRSLAILYEVAASINKYRDLDDLLTHFLHTLRDVTDARAATVRLLGSDKKMRLVASLGLDDSANATPSSASRFLMKKRTSPCSPYHCNTAATTSASTTCFLTKPGLPSAATSPNCWTASAATSAWPSKRPTWTSRPSACR